MQTLLAALPRCSLGCRGALRWRRRDLVNGALATSACDGHERLLGARRAARAADTWDGDRLRWWHGEPESYAIDEGRLTVVARPGRDWWRRTFYDPALDKKDGPAYLCRVPARHAYAMTTAFTLEPRADGDQCGCMIWLDEDVWLKAGLEIIGGEPHLAVTSTTRFSDRSLTPWAGLSARVRLHKVKAPTGNCVVVEAAPHAPGAALDAAGDWRVVRVAPLAHDLDRWERTAPHWHSGVFCFAPVGGEGTSTPTKKKPEDDEEETKEPPLCRAVFDGVEIREGAPLPLSQATNIPRDPPPVEDDDPPTTSKNATPTTPRGTSVRLAVSPGRVTRSSDDANSREESNHSHIAYYIYRPPRHELVLEVPVDAVVAALAAEARFFRAAEGHGRVAHGPLVDADDAEIHSFDARPRPRRGPARRRRRPRGLRVPRSRAESLLRHRRTKQCRRPVRRSPAARARCRWRRLPQSARRTSPVRRACCRRRPPGRAQTTAPFTLS